MASENGGDSNPPLLPKHSKYFLRPWTVTVPSYPGLKFYRATPSHFDAWIPIITDPQNNELLDTKDKVWDDAAVAEWRADTAARYHEASIKFSELGVLIEHDGQVVGYGDVYPTSTGTVSIGVLLNKVARRRGIGKTAVRVLVQIAFDFSRPIGTGTMKVNVPMRALMASLGVAEKEEVITVAGRGVLAEIVYRIERETWREMEMKVEFEQEESSEEGDGGDS